MLQSVLDPAGPYAASIHTLWRLFLWTTTAVFIIVMGLVAAAVWRHPPQPTEVRSLTRSVAAAAAATVAILFGLLLASIWTTRSIRTLEASNALTIAVVGHQWWWEIEYEHALPSLRVLTANELHVPLGRPVVLRVTSRDVIHSFWVPNLQGKRDLVPGYTTAIWLQADRPGVYRGQCAEFCGRQHAHMAFTVVAEPQADFDRWLAGMREPGHDAQTDEQRRGRDVFMKTRCAGCHRIRGTDASGSIAPDLTHVGSRSTLGAGTLSNSREHLRQWIEDPQRPKPGNQMPPNPIDAADLDALVAYLESLR
jgi:cytochrome c oxidase subunit II